MADTPSLGDFFAKKGKKKIQATNLNAAPVAKAEAKKKEKKDAEEENWAEEEVATTAMAGVGPAGKLTREDEKEKEEDNSAPAWGSGKSRNKAVVSARDGAHDVMKFDKKFPTLGKSLNSSNINIDDGSDGRVNIATNKNKFADLEGDDEDDQQGPRRPKEIKPAMVSKKQGEREKDVVKKEVEKYVPASAKDGEEEEKDASNKESSTATPAEKEKEVEEDRKIVADLMAAKDKYKGRRRLEPKELPQEELEEDKVVKQVSKKKAKVFDEDEEEMGGKKKLQYVKAAVAA